MRRSKLTVEKVLYNGNIRSSRNSCALSMPNFLQMLHMEYGEMNKNYN
jgi:hypothetical protein